jgi:hypothetical protein
MRRRNSSLTLLSVARMRSRRVVLLTRNCAKLALISQKIKLAEAIRYTLSRWQG